MLQVIQHETRFSEIQQPDRVMIREKNEVEIVVEVIPKQFNAPPKDRQRLIVMVNYHFKEFMCKEPVEIAHALCKFDIFTNRNVLLIELYRITVSATESLRTYIFSQSSPYFVNEEFPLDPPDFIRAKLGTALQKINCPLKPTNVALN